ncbi:MAG: hydantoinase/oxoprolinase family protein [Candidatus Marinimicrobia bacterium]|nr:hydantoinase/oxoprolinase family protein [Candidatus Neomarinimicrobiota bacterium]MCF7828691.1 hydantoinase/oxoprolinase family protein [Candidatus Neomarinimicrobiota bacterium]MCF7880432.1 hydantoinase/oxoprolinase family protein [Candidatus Neomarinimicrobiota bacterium]
MIIGIDTGGTFTDFFWFDPETGGTLQVLKEPSTPDEPSQAVLSGLERIGSNFPSIVHGSTVATNAVLERNGADVVLLTTKGFEDVTEIGRQTRSDIYDFNVDRPEPLVSREKRIGIPERVDKEGNVLTPLEIPAETIAHLKELNPEAVAVCYLFGYLNPIHEEQTREKLREAGIRTCWSLSSAVSPEYREYERFSTTVMNAYVTPVMDRYLGALDDELETEHFRVMQSNGGSMEAEKARQEAVQTLLSGPAGGVVAAKTIADQCRIDHVISFDMGGTSTDVSFLPGEILMTRESEIDGLPVQLPMIQINTVGAGGGSIAYRDNAGVLQVGPKSAGADPGPVCYDRGGTDLTVTDANFLCGRLPGEAVFGDAIKLNGAKTEQVAKALSDKFGLATGELAESIISLANARMERAIRVVSVEQGYDPGDATLMPFGGAGPLHGCAIAESLGISKILIPIHAGVFSAFGLLWADVVRDRTRTILRHNRDIDWEAISADLETMQKKVISEIREQGIGKDNITAEWTLDMRYRGQSYELAIPWQDNMIEAFHRRHEERYTFQHDDRPVEVVNLRVRGIGSVDKPKLPRHSLEKREVETAEFSTQEGMINGNNATLPIIPRDDLWPGASGDGPCVIPEQTSTTYVAPEWSFTVDEYGHLHLEKQ